jgi:magnesium-transporting ATPase (P-type)
VVTGRELSEAGTPDSPAFEKLVSSTHVFARVSPTQKLEIVDVLIRRGEFVAVTGDGVNDAPALRRANIGVAMGSGTDVAKEVGSMIVADDNFASIVAGVEEGRFAYDNVRKVIYLLISTGAAEVLMFIAAILAGLPIPLLAVQLLWLNLVTNGIQDVALAFEGGEPGAMKRKPRRPEETIFDPQMIGRPCFGIDHRRPGLWILVLDDARPNDGRSRGPQQCPAPDGLAPECACVQLPLRVGIRPQGPPAPQLSFSFSAWWRPRDPYP